MFFCEFAKKRNPDQISREFITNTYDWRNEHKSSFFIKMNILTKINNTFESCQS